MARLPKGLNPNEFTKKDQRWNSDSLSPEIFNASANLEGPGMGGWTTHVTKHSEARDSTLRAMEQQYKWEAPGGATFTPLDVNAVPSGTTYKQGNTTPFKSQVNRTVALGDIENEFGSNNRKAKFGLAQDGTNMQPEIGLPRDKVGVKPARPLEEGNAPKKMNDFVAALNLEKETPTGITNYNAPNAAAFLEKQKSLLDKKGKDKHVGEPWKEPSLEGRPKGGGRGKEWEAGSDWWHNPGGGGKGKEPVAEGRPKKTKGNRRDSQQWPPIQLFGGGIG